MENPTVQQLVQRTKEVQESMQKLMDDYKEEMAALGVEAFMTIETATHITGEPIWQNIKISAHIKTE
jgi:chorismate synthase